MVKRVSNAEIRRVWLDSALTVSAAAKLVGLARATLWKRAKALGLPARKDGRREVIPPSDLRLLWAAGVLTKDIAAHYGCAAPSVSQSARRLGLPKRKQGRKSLQALSDYKAELLGRALQRLVQNETPERNARLKDLAAEHHTA